MYEEADLDKLWMIHYIYIIFFGTAANRLFIVALSQAPGHKHWSYRYGLQRVAHERDANYPCQAKERKIDKHL